jgi:leucyl/phenylalanyl-tRNA--protein transferase
MARSRPAWRDAISIDASAARRPQALPGGAYVFPDARLAGPEGLVATGGDFEPETIVGAYRAGLFPWPHPPEDLLWFSPDPRAIIPIGGLHISRRLARTIRHGRFHATIDRAFAAVVDRCAERAEGTWITPGYRAAYLRLYELGWAHSFEVWTKDEELAGGLYGLAAGALFGAESMFHRVTDASKVAMVAMMTHLESRGFELVDVQLLTPHLARMGAVEIARDEYLRRARKAVDLAVSG